MNTIIFASPLRSTAGVAAVLLALLSAATVAFADPDIDDLQRELDEIKALVESGTGDASDRIAALELELAELRAHAESGAADGDTAAGTADASVEPSAADIPAGEQGAPNPLRQETPYLTGQDLLDESFPGSIPIPGAGGRLKISGYAKVDFIQDFDYVGDRYEFELATIPVEGTPEAALDGRTTAHAKETRLAFDYRTRARNNSLEWDFPVQAFVEIDFFDDRESFALQPRLRQSYVVIGRVLAGRSWGVTSDVSALAGLIDFSGGDALYGTRIEQIRWQDRLNNDMVWSIGLEGPTTNIDNPFGLDGADRPSLPSLGGALRKEFEDGSHWQLGADLFRLEWQGGASGPDDTAIGYALSLSGRWLIGPGNRDALVGTATVGEGASHRVVSLSFANNDAVITPNGLDVTSHWQVYAGYSHYWTDSLNSSFTIARAELDNSEFQGDDAIRRATSLHANLIWFPYPKASTGVELMWGERENKNGASGDAVRLQFMVKYKFP